MSRSPLFANVRRALRIAHYAEAKRLSTADAIERVREAETRAWSRRAFLGGSAALAAGCALDAGENVGRAGSAITNADVGIVGAGYASLVCTDELARNGVVV